MKAPLGKCFSRIEPLESRIAPAFAADVELSTLSGLDGFRDNGRISANAGDVNGDGFDDVIAYSADGSAGYVLFGKAGGFSTEIDLSTLDGTDGFKINPASANALVSASRAGDVNGDGFDDLIIGLRVGTSFRSTGAASVVFGKAGGFAAQLDLAGLDGSNGFKISSTSHDSFGASVSAAGDFNGDGFGDLVIGAPGTASHGDYSGAAYVFFGKANGFAANLSLANANGSRISGAAQGDFLGVSVSAAGDFNGDGFDDVIIGASAADPNGAASGASYVVFGRAAPSPNLESSALNGSNGFKISGVERGDGSGGSVSGAGDLNGDGFDDVIIGAPGAGPVGSGSSGATYVIFGNADVFAANLNLSTLDGSNGFKLSGTAMGDRSGSSVSMAGDINGDGFGDLIIGAPGVDASGYDSGGSYVVLGKGGGFAPDMNVSNLNGSNGFKIVGVGKSDYSGSWVSGGGDVNGDGFSDLIISAPRAWFNGAYSGASYVIFGASTATVSISDATAVEGNSGSTTDLTFTVSLSAKSTVPISVQYGTQFGDAYNNEFIPVSNELLTFAPGEVSKTITVTAVGDTRVEKHETFSVVLAEATNGEIADGTGIGTILNDDTLIRISDASVLEGHAGTRAIAFTVSLSAPSALPVSMELAILDGTAVAGVDYVAITRGTISFAPGEIHKTISVEVLPDVVAEPSKTLSITLSEAVNGIIDDGTAVGTILDDDVTLLGKHKATFIDVDGDRVTIKVNKGTLKVDDFTIVPSGDGAQLALVDFSGQAEFNGADLRISASRGPGGGGGAHLVGVGYINATGIDLGHVVVKGDLGRIDVGNDFDLKPALLSLRVNSLGDRGLEAQLSDRQLISHIAGSLKVLTLADGMRDATLLVSGDIQLATIKGSVLGSVIHADGKIGDIRIAGDLAATETNTSIISARGNFAPSSAAKVLTIARVFIGGSVSDSQILAGYDRSSAAINEFVGIGSVTVGEDWIASSLAAGISAGPDGVFGTNDDAPISGITSVISRIASIRIKGTASGTEHGGDQFGFVAEEIGSFQVGDTKFPLRPGPINDVTAVPVGSTGDLWLREVG